MLGDFFGKKLSFWPFLDFFTKQIKKSHKISNDGAQNRHQIYYKHLAIISSLGMKKSWDLFLAKNLASTSFYYLAYGNILGVFQKISVTFAVFYSFSSFNNILSFCINNFSEMYH